MRLENQVAVITGASAGIGRAATEALAAEGANVVAVARRTERLDELVTALEADGHGALAVTADVADETDVARVVSETHERFGRVDILVNNVGVGKYGALETLTPDDFDWMMRSNVRTSYLCTRAVLPEMLDRGHGQICFVGSVAGLRGFPEETVYCASKFAQMGFAQSLDHETRDRGVKVSVIAPGGVHTEFAIGTGRIAGDPALEGLLEPEDVAEAIVFALTQPTKARTFLVGMRPMAEPL